MPFCRPSVGTHMISLGAGNLRCEPRLAVRTSVVSVS